MIKLTEKICAYFKKEKLDMFLLIFSFTFALAACIFIFHKSFWNKIFFVPPKNYGLYSDSFFILYFLFTVAVMTLILVFLKKASFLSMITRVFLVFLPGQLIFIYGLDKVICVTSKKASCLALNNFLPLTTPFYFLLAFFIIVLWQFKAVKINFSPKKFILGIKNKTRYIKWFSIAIISVVFLINLILGSNHIAKYAAVDEAYWTFDRTPKYWDGIIKGEWKRTNISDKPGITVALISGIGMAFVNPLEYEPIRWQGQIYGTPKNIEEMNWYLRFPIMFFCALSIFGFYFLIRKLWGEDIALFSSIFIGLSPLLLGISRIINPDSLLWIFTSFSILCWFIYFKKDFKKGYLYWSGIFLGLSLLTKYIANILYVFFFAIIFFEYIFDRKNYDMAEVGSYLKKRLLDYLILVFISFMVFILLFPATWIEFSFLFRATILSQAFEKVKYVFLLILGIVFWDMYIMKSTLTSSFFRILGKYRKIITQGIILIFILSVVFVILNTYSGMKWMDFESILASPKSAFKTTWIWGIFLANFYSMVFGVIPLALFATIYACFKKIGKINQGIDNFFLYLIVFILLYYFASAVNLVSSTIRYQIIIYPLIFMVAATGITVFLSEINFFKPWKKVVYILTVTFSLISLLSIKPFYFSYASDLLPKEYVLNLKDMGDGSYEAAQYLNNLPNAKDLSIWSDKKGVCTFFLGKCFIGVEFKKEDETDFDYFVLSSGRKNRTTNINKNKLSASVTEFKIYPLYEMNNPDFEIKIGGRSNNFIKIFSSSKLNSISDK